VFICVYNIKKKKYYCFKFKFKLKKKKIAKIWKLAIKHTCVYIWIIKHYTDIDPSVNTRPRISCLSNRSRAKWNKRF
jgi:hypothetical protein